jgi:exopolyphosphatase/guanosine-5'-triphosphate,3'-diphosphate pyrophosphatase
MRVAVVDLGSNSTRLLVADVEADGTVTERDRRSTVTRLGQGVDRTGVLADEAIARVLAALTEYRAAIDDLGADAVVGVLTSAVRDAANGATLTATVRDEFGIDARTIPGEEEARLTYRGATSGREDAGATTLVVDIGGGSTELVVGRGAEMLSHVSTQVGVVRHSERHLHSDPPTPGELAALQADVASTFLEYGRADVAAGIAVAGTATSCAAMLLELRAHAEGRGGSAYDPERVEGFVLHRATLEDLLARTAAMTTEERRSLPGLHPDRAPTIVAGIAVLLEVMLAFALDVVSVSEHDILRGVALDRAGVGR